MTKSSETQNSDALSQETKTPDAAITLSIVVLSLTSREQTLNCLQQLRESNVLSSSPGATSEVIVVDLVAPQAHAPEIATDFPCVTVIEGSPEIGFAKACNLALSAAHADHILLIDPFTEIPGRLIPDMVLHIDSNERVAAVGPQLIDTRGLAIEPATHIPCERPDANGAHAPGAPLGNPTATLRAVEWLPATCLMLNRTAVDEIGAFEGGFLSQFEEIDWCRRAREAAWHVHHLNSVSVVLLEDTRPPAGDGEAAGELPYDGQFSDSRRAYVRQYHGSATALAVDAVKGGAQKLVRSAKAAIGLSSEEQG